MEAPDLEREPAEALGPERVREVRRRLLEHYDSHRRDLPWREDDDPYRIWVSEVMLQQTRVDTVIPYYRRWMERFPKLGDLAAADQEEVLQLWKGLGYYSRARNLHRAARLVRERHGGEVPDTVEELEELPGVGKYTAGAVASIAFQRPAPAVDGNVRRVLSRLQDLADPGAAELRRKADALVDPDRPGCFNQALMELGATICTSGSPDCEVCPVEDLCLARSRGTVEERPAPRKRPRVREEVRAVAIPVSADGHTLLVQRPEDGLLGGLWEFPSGEVASAAVTGGAEGEEAEAMTNAPAKVAREAAEASGARPGSGTPVGLGSVRHSFTHLRVTYQLHLFPDTDLDEVPTGGTVPVVGRKRTGGSDPDAGEEGRSADCRVVHLTELDSVPLPVAQQKIGRRALDAVRERDEPGIR